MPQIPGDSGVAGGACPDVLPVDVLLMLLLVLPKRCMPQPCRCRAASAAAEGVAGTAEKVSLLSSLRSLSKTRLMNSWPCRDTSSNRPGSMKQTNTQSCVGEDMQDKKG